MKVSFHRFPEQIQLALYNYLTCVSYADSGTIWISGQEETCSFRTKFEKKKLSFTMVAFGKEIKATSTNLNSIQTIQPNLVIPKELFIIPRALGGLEVNFIYEYDLTKPVLLEITRECVLVSYRSNAMDDKTISFVLNRMFGSIFQITLKNETGVYARLIIPKLQVSIKKGREALLLTAPAQMNEL